MFHLLVSAKGWEDGGDTIPTGRIYIRADDTSGKRMLTDGKLDIAKVSRFPALLMTETTGREPRIARVAHITSISSGARETTLRYLIDTSIPTISSKDLEDFVGEMGIDKFSLAHTHWCVCEADLFRIWLQVQQKNAASSKPPKATVFSTDGIYDQDDELVSVMMPFGAEFMPIYKAIRNGVEEAGLQCERADDIWRHHEVIQDIVDLVTKARVVIGDCTGKNPNVFYEIGIAHALGKDVILIAQSKGDIPFDLRHLRYVEYLRNREGLRELTKAVQARMKTLIG
jgi:hypothetical protein